VQIELIPAAIAIHGPIDGKNALYSAILFH